MENESPAAAICPKCGLRRMMPNLKVRAYGSDVAKVIVAVEKRAATIWRGANYQSSGVTAHVCGSCGYTEFYSDTPEQLWEVWQQINR